MSRAPPPQQQPSAVIEEIEPQDEIEQQPEDQSLDVELSEGEYDEDGEGGEGYEEDEEYFDLAQLSQLLVTEEGEPLADVLKGIRDALDKHNKILFRLVGAADKLAAAAK